MDADTPPIDGVQLVPVVVDYFEDLVTRKVLLERRIAGLEAQLAELLDGRKDADR